MSLVARGLARPGGGLVTAGLGVFAAVVEALAPQTDWDGAAALPVSPAETRRRKRRREEEALFVLGVLS